MEPSLIRTLLVACGLTSLQDEVQTLPGRCVLSRDGVHSPRSLLTLPSCLWPQFLRRRGVDTPGMVRWPGGEETRAVAAGEFPKVPPEGLCLFEKILLLNPANPYKEGPVL